MTIEIRLAPSGSGDLCRSILDELPAWFGLPESNAAYAQLAEAGPAWVASAEGQEVGLMVLKRHFEETLEIELIAVRPARHRGGAGRALVEQALALARSEGRRFLTVKTRGPSLPYEPYERTRAFYLGMGFTPLEEFVEIWGPENPALLMARSVD